MSEPGLSLKVKNMLDDLCKGLTAVYGDGLVSVILYGSAATPEGARKADNFNVLVVLGSAALAELKKAVPLLKKFKGSVLPLFVTEDYISRSLDIFPIEFLDMLENHHLLCGRDALRDISVDTRNLRFQCEHELKSKLLWLRQAYLAADKDTAALKKILVKGFTSVLHLARNVLRIKGKNPPYDRQELLRHLAAEFHIDATIWEKILALKLGMLTFRSQAIDELFAGFMRDLESLVNIVDMM